VISDSSFGSIVSQYTLQTSNASKHATWTHNYFFIIINVNVHINLCVSRLILQTLKLINLCVSRLILQTLKLIII
jgi:hypothetical protein